MERAKVEVLGLCEVRWNQSAEYVTDDGKLFIYSGMPEEDDDHVHGVGIIFSRSMRNSLLEWTAISERLMTARIRCKHRNLTIVQVYAPTEEAATDKKEAFYSQLDGVLARIPRRDVVMLMGDLNARVGSANEDLDHIMGKHGVGNMNENGSLFVELCGNHGLKIGGTLFPHKECHKNTWLSNDHVTTAQLDHVCISSRWSKSLLDVRVLRGADIGSDHHLLIASIRLNFMRINRRKTPNRRKFNIHKLGIREVKSQFVEKVRENTTSEGTANADTIDAHWGNIKKIFVEAAQEILGYETHQRKEYISDETWNIIEERRAVKMRRCAENEPDQIRELDLIYSDLNKRVKRLVRRDWRAHLDGLAEEAQNSANMGHISKVYKAISKLVGKSSNSRIPVKSKDGKPLTAAEEQLRRWREHFEEVLNQPSSPPAEEDQEIHTPLRIRTDPPSKAEIVKALKDLKTNKAAGIDGIPAELLKADIDVTAEILQPLFSGIWTSETIPDDWKRGVIVKIPKKGDLSNCKNWRGINLLCVTSKVFCSIILNRMMSELEGSIRREQAGFRPGRSCVDQINSLRIIIEQSVEMRSRLYMLFIDFQVAFDSLNRDCIWKALKKRGLPEKVINVIKGLYSGFECCVLHNGQLTESFETVSGVRQGCILSPLLFLIVLDEVLRRAFSGSRRGIQWRLNEHLEDLDYADDIVLLSHNHRDMQSKTDDLVNEAQKVGLKVNISKTKDLRVNSNTREAFRIGEEMIESVEDFTYLGSKVAADGGGLSDINHRINKARGAFAKLRPVWRSNNINLHLKVKLFNACVKSVLLYGCETWFVTTNICQRLQAFVNRCLRNILGIWWPRKITNQLLWEKTGQSSINVEIKRRKFGWIGHTLRRNETEIPHSALEWNPQGSRRPGRPKNTWRRTVLAECGKTSFGELRATAKNRHRWKLKVDSLCSNGVWL
jgi:exonuclease III